MINNPFLTIIESLSRIEQDLEELKYIQKEGAGVPVQDIITIHQASSLTGYAVQTLYGKVSRKEIPFMKKGGKLWFSRKELIEWVSDGKQVSIEEHVNKMICIPKKRKERAMRNN